MEISTNDKVAAKIKKSPQKAPTAIYEPEFLLKREKEVEYSDSFIISSSYFVSQLIARPSPIEFR